MTIEAMPAPATPPAGSVPQNGGATTAGQARGEPRTPGNRGDDRIHELIRKHAKAEAEWEQKERHYQERLEAQDSRLEALEQRMSPKGQGVAENGGEDLFRSWQDVPDDRLQKVIRAGQEANPDLWVMAFEERQRRTAEQAKEAALKAMTERETRREDSTRTWSELVTYYGQELDDPKSELRERAEALMAEKRRTAKRMGRPDPVGNPYAEEACVARAFRELHAGDQVELEALRRRNEELKRMEALESGARVARTQIDENAKKLLQEGKISESLRSLPLIQGLRARFE